MSVRNCDFSQVDFPFEFSQNILSPTCKESRFTVLNKGAIRLDESTFEKVDYPATCKGDCCYTSNDPRLKDPIRNITTVLDRPPFSEEIGLDNIYTDTRLDNYGSQYNNYKDINTGQYMYYVDHTISKPFFKPLFSTEADIRGVVYKDPMGGIKPHYSRKSIVPNEGYCLSWIRDSTEHREDLMARQMWRTNQQKWESRWNTP